jgi:hypothetical protein
MAQDVAAETDEYLLLQLTTALSAALADATSTTFFTGSAKVRHAAGYARAPRSITTSIAAASTSFPT